VDTTTAVFLNEYALGQQLTAKHFSVREHSLPPVPDGGLMIETIYLSVDPYLRGCMTGLGNYYAPQFELSAPVYSMGIGQVLQSRDPAFAERDIVLGALDWSPITVWDPGTTSRRQPGGNLRQIKPAAVALSHHLGALGTTGLTAFFGVLAVAQPQPGETFLVSSAAGGVGSIAGQIAKLRGATVYGLTSTREKRDVVMNRFDFEDALDYRSPTLARDILELMPRGPDIYFDTVGGQLGQTVMSLMRRPARVIECGQISTYDDDDGGWLVDIRPIHNLGLRFEAFNSMLYADFHPGAVAQLEHWIRTGAVIPLQTEHYGFTALVPAFLDMLQGGNIGKTIVNVGWRGQKDETCIPYT
jgi:NADPH-dependent curcumin reductase CurA